MERVDGVILDANGTKVIHLLMEDGSQVLLDETTKEVLFDSKKDQEVPDIFCKKDEEGKPVLKSGKKIELHQFAGQPLMRERSVAMKELK